MPIRFWDKAFHTAYFLINSMPSRVNDNEVPLTRLFGSTPDYIMLRVYGCAYWPNLRPYKNHKLDFRSSQCVFISYSSIHKGCKCFHLRKLLEFISRDVVLISIDFLLKRPFLVLLILIKLYPNTQFLEFYQITPLQFLNPTWQWMIFNSALPNQCLCAILKCRS